MASAKTSEQSAPAIPAGTAFRENDAFDPKSVWAETEFAQPERVNENVDWNFRHLRHYIPEHKDIAVLDVGCGNGRHLDELMRRGYLNATGIDIFEEIPLKHVNYRRGSVDSIPFPDATFDFIYSLGSVVSHTPHPSVWAQEFARVMKPGATFMVTAHTLHSTLTTTRRLRRAVNHPNWQHLKGFHFYSTGAIKRALEEAGLEEIEVNGYKTSVLWLVRPINNKLVRPALAKIGIDVPYLKPWVARSRWMKKINSVIGYHAVYVYRKPA